MNKEIEIMSCQALTQQGPHKGALCGKKTMHNIAYCSKHRRQGILDQAKQDNIRYCDVTRGCFTVLEEHQRCCADCLHRARIRDRKRDGEKRSDPNACLDCGRPLTKEIRAIGKHNKELRRCVPCYAKLQEIEANRPIRKRNYKAEAFHNKHVAWNHYVKGAKQRGLDMTLSKTRFEELLLLPCFYCRHHVEGEINGIDRINNHEGYTESNSVTCCEPCNMAKGSQNPQEWFDKLHAIHLFQTTRAPLSPERVDKWSTTYRTTSIPRHTSYGTSAKKRNLSFEISKEEFEEIVKQPCYLCGLAPSEHHHNGVDRYDNTIGYLPENCRSCCGHCNMMKKDATCETILSIAEQIHGRYDELTSYCASLDLLRRASKVEPRKKKEAPLLAEREERTYQPVNEVIMPDTTPHPNHVASVLHCVDPLPEPKQWKVNAIYKAIQCDEEMKYKKFCEEHNACEKDATWSATWDTMIQAVKGHPLDEVKNVIHEFIVHLRYLRYMIKSTKAPVEREDRQQWPSHTIVRAFVEGNITLFKQWTEVYAGDDPADPVWIKRWDAFIATLEAHEEEKTRLSLCRAFLTAQRTKKYRRSFIPI